LLAAELKLGVNIELKPPKGKSQELISALRACIKSYWPDDLPLPLLSSFDWDCLTALKNVQASYPIGLLMHEWKSAWLAKATELSCATVNVNQEILTVERVAAINEAGYPLLSYTVNSKQRAQELFNWGVAGVFTDAIDQLQTEEGNS
jgi:glycerophosphoryl diester phosphodiesterase